MLTPDNRQPRAIATNFPLLIASNKNVEADDNANRNRHVEYGLHQLHQLCCYSCRVLTLIPNPA